MSATLHVTDMKLEGDAYIVLEVSKDNALRIYADAYNSGIAVEFPPTKESIDEVRCLISSLQTWCDHCEIKEEKR